MDVVQHGEEAYVTGEGAILVLPDGMRRSRSRSPIRGSCGWVVGVPQPPFRQDLLVEASAEFMPGCGSGAWPASRSLLPAASVAQTLKVWRPGLRPRIAARQVQARGLPLSSLHAKAEPASLEREGELGLPFPSFPARGPSSILSAEGSCRRVGRWRRRWRWRRRRPGDRPQTPQS